MNISLLNRYTQRKRIKAIKSFVKANKYNLVVLSDVPGKKNSTYIKYLGKGNPYLARE